ncbi:DNA-methyltransferase [Candidatus Avelusimicrobium caledoniensis]|uniref:DNA-methyltransferase n=1 Tax=Candidatus Avelusimicrobium caledoniensis TaxID=3416220 RepID=UPI003D10901A
MQDFKNKIILGDCIEEMKKLPSSSFDIVIADPPYNIGKDFGNNFDNYSLEEYISWSKKWIRECRRLLKDTGTMFVYGFDEILAHLSVMFPIGQQRWLIWYYTNKNVPSLNFWQRSHESIICHWKQTPIFNRDNVREPYTEGFLKGSAGRIRPNTKGRFSRESSQPTVYKAHAQGALPRDVFSISTLAGGAALRERNIFCKTCGKLIDPHQRKFHEGHDVIIHPTQKPLSLTEKLILSSKPKSDFSVLIPFGGSGSECLCTLTHGGQFTAFELNPDYVKLSQAVVDNYMSSCLL